MKDESAESDWYVDGRRAHILWAEDDPDVRDYVAKLLGTRFVVTAVADGREALEAARASRPDVVLSDAVMPWLDGLGLLRELRADPALRACPFLIVSARDEVEARIEGLSEGADDYLVKPFSSEELVARVQTQVTRARMESALRESEQRLRSALVAGKMAHWRWNLDTDRLFASRTMDRLYGIAGGETFESVARGFRLVHPDDVAGHRAIVEAALREGRGWNSEFRIVRPSDGATVWLEEAATPVTGSVPGTREVVALVRDVTERKNAEELVRQSEQRARLLLEEAKAARAEAEAANRSKDEFLATLSHELRTPLAAILLWARALRSGAVPLNDLTRAVDAIADSAESQSRLIEDLLDLSRLSADKLVLLRSPVEIGAVVRAALEVVRPLAAEKNVALISDVGELGRAAVDPARLKQILWNLLTNAVKFTPPLGRVTVVAERRGDHLEIEVADTGEGISADFLPHLFERFRQADMAATRRHMGLGVGLALAKRLAELHGGTIEAESDGPGRGAVFRVHLPWVAPADADLSGAEPGDEHAGPEPSASPLEGLRLLLVEDDANTREAMRWMLERAGARVTAVASGHAALAELQHPGSASGLEVIVTDLGLPGMSGYELLERVSEHCRKHGRKPPPACAVSAHARDVDRERAFACGFDVYVTKPVTPERLVQAALDLKIVSGASFSTPPPSSDRD